MHRKLTSIIVISVITASFCGAFDLVEPQFLLGSRIENLFQSDVIPDEIFSHRGVEEDEDNVVFYYDNGVYLFLYSNRVWQVRFDRTYSEKIMNMEMGFSRSDILTSFLELEKIPISSGEDFVTFQMDDAPYPVRVKLYFVDDFLDDFYIYRADF